MAIKKEKGAVKALNVKSKTVETPKAKSKKTEDPKVRTKVVKVSAAERVKEPTGEEYLAENLELLTKISAATGKTIEMMSVEIEKIKSNRTSLNTLALSVRQAADNIDYLTQKLGSVAGHVIALEVILGEIAPDAKLDMKNIVAKIRKKIADGTDGKGDPAKAIDVATLLISRE